MVIETQKSPAEAVKDYAAIKGHDEFVITSKSPVGQNELLPIGNVATEAVNFARRLKNQQYHTDVQIWQWDKERNIKGIHHKGTNTFIKADGHSGLPDYQSKAFAVTVSAPNGDVQFKREAAAALGLLENRVRTVKAARTFTEGERGQLVNEFVTAYYKIGGSHQELMDYLHPVSQPTN